MTKILFIEDTASVLTAFEQLAEELGISYVSAMNFADGESLLEEPGSEITHVIIDTRLPDARATSDRLAKRLKDRGYKGQIIGTSSHEGYLPLLIGQGDCDKVMHKNKIPDFIRSLTLSVPVCV